MSYVITGGAGFIGANLVEYLLNLGRQVKVIDNFSTGRNIIYGSEFNKADIRNDVSSIINEDDYVVHLAALPSVQRSIDDPIESNSVNVSGTLNMLEICRRANVKKFVFISSSSVYGEGEGIKKESDKVDPLSPYALTKLAGEYYCKLYKELYGLNTIVLRFFNVFGKYQDPNSEYSAVIPKFKSNEPIIYGDGTQSRDFTHVSNNVNAIYKACHSDSNDVFNIACGKSNSLIELCRLLDKKPKFDKARKGDIKHSLADISKAKDILGYKVITHFEQGLWM